MNVGVCLVGVVVSTANGPAGDPETLITYPPGPLTNEIGVQLNVIECSRCAATRTSDGATVCVRSQSASNVRVAAQREHSITLSWTPISFVSGPGGYVISVSGSPAGPFAVLTTTPTKQTPTFIVDGLERSTNYYFAVSTVSYPSGEQQNVVVSDSTTPVAAATTAGTPAPANIVVLAYPGEILQQPGTTGEAEYFIENLGDLPAQITLTQNGDFFAQDVTSFSLGREEIRRIVLTGKVKPVGAYRGQSLIAGDGVPAGLSVQVSMLVS